MEKTKYNEAATKYASDYLEHLLNMEDVLGRRMEKCVDKLVEHKMQQYMAQLDRQSNAEKLENQSDENL